jgi:LDH2 family malate/lactate/ureidoglycolate dehydrogenase
MSSHEDVRVVRADELRRFCAGVFAHFGVPAADAEIVADNLVEADLRGVESHGVHLVPLYVARLKGGHVRADAKVEVVRDEGSMVLLDGGLGFGQVAGIEAMDRAVAKAREFGTGAAAVRESTHLGALAYFTLRAAGHDCIAMAWQNGPPIVPPFGGLDGVFSTNPFSYALPAGEELPIVLDMATTAVAGNKVLLAKKRGDPTIPEGWANDDQGRPTTDTMAASTRHLQWFGGYKGFGIAFMVDVLAGVLTGSSFGRIEISDAQPQGPDRVVKGYLFVALDIAHFMPVDEFRRRTDMLIRDVRGARPAAGVERIYVPGEREHEMRAHRLRDGIPVSEAVSLELDGFAEELGIEPVAFER